MITHLLLLSLGLILLYFGAEGLIRGASSLALRFGVTPLVVGLTVVAFGTSAPEMVVSTKAAYLNQGGIAVGNVVGSNIFNIAVILGLAAVIRPMTVQLQLIKFDTPIMIAVSVLCLAVFSNGILGRGEAAFLFAGIILYTVVNIVMARREKSAQVATEFSEGTPHQSKSLVLDFVLIIGGLVLLVLGARLLVDASVAMARIWGVSEAVIGLTIIAAGTSMPELATSVVAAMRKESDIAIGNVVGSNIFNILSILGVAGLVKPLQTGGVNMADFGLVIATAIILLPLMMTGKRIARPEGLLLLGIYGGYLYWLWPK